MDLWELERAYRAEGYQLICGADEAGAGPLAGAVYAAAVILPHELEIPGLNDSKKLTEKRREALFPVIQERAVAWAVDAVDAATIDQINILNARLLAMERAIQALVPRAEFALIDGNRDRGITGPRVTVIKGDGRSASIAAASVLAKVSRDRYMAHMAEEYPLYEFERHKGYPTQRHYQLLRTYGPCPIHRRTFLKNG